MNIVLACADKLPIGFYLFDKNFSPKGASKFIQGIKYFIYFCEINLLYF